MRIGIVGTGFAAKLRAGALAEDERCKLVGVAGHTPHRVAEFSKQFNAAIATDWHTLVQANDIDLVFVSTVNCDHGSIARAALEAGKHVVVEYPLSFDIDEAKALIAMSRQRKLLLHVEHIELLSGIHTTLQAELPALGPIFYAQYDTIATANPAPNRWSYSPQLFGFPLVGALSRVHRLVDLLGPVRSVACQLRYDGESLPEQYSSCLCTAQLAFVSGAVANLTYGKGERLWRSRRVIELHGLNGSIQLGDDRNVVIYKDEARPVAIGSRRGLFYRDTQMVLDHLENGTPLYVDLDRSIHAHEVAIAAERSAKTRQTVTLPLTPSNR